MKTSFIQWTLFLAVATTGLTACTNEDNFKENTVEDGANLPEGYFRATFFPQADKGGNNTRAAVNGTSDQIQSLICLIYQKQADGSYTYYTKDDNIIEYTGTTGKVDAQLYTWPFKDKQVQFDLPVGDYKAVFVGNSDKKLFSRQGENEILTGYQDGFSTARINMPEIGPAGYNKYNMPYLCTVDFSSANPSPDVLLQRVVAQNVYGRDFINTNEAVNKLVNNIVSEIRRNQLTTDVVKGLLHSKILDALSNATGLDVIAGSLTAVVDRLVNLLLGDIVEALNKLLLDEITTRLENSLNGIGGGNGLIGLGYLLNPWTVVNNVDVTFESLPKSIDFNRVARASYSNKTWTFPVTKASDNSSSLSVVSLCGEEKLTSIDVNSNDATMNSILKSALAQLDEQALNGLLVNIHTPLAYTQNSNLQYSTRYELLNLMLKDNSETNDKLGLNLNLNKIVDIESLVKKLLGDNIITGLIGGLTNQLVEPLTKALDKVVLALDIKLPNLGIGNIKVDGGWNATQVSDGTIAPNTAK